MKDPLHVNVGELLDIIQIRTNNLSKYYERGLKRPQAYKDGQKLFYIPEVLSFFEGKKQQQFGSTKAIIRRIRDYISAQTPTIQDTQNKQTQEETMKEEPKNPERKPFKHYSPDRLYVEGDEVEIRLCCGRMNGIPLSYIDRLAIVTKNENSYGTAYVKPRQGGEQQIQVPVCNLRLIRAVEDIPRYCILNADNGFYVTTKGVKEAVCAFWYGEDTKQTREDAQAAAELQLETYKSGEDNL